MLIFLKVINQEFEETIKKPAGIGCFLCVFLGEITQEWFRGEKRNWGVCVMGRERGRHINA